MLSRKQKKELKKKAIEKERWKIFILDKKGLLVAEVISLKGDNFWIYGALKPLDGYDKYKNMFNQAGDLEARVDEASSNDDDLSYDRYQDELNELYDKLSAMGFKVWNKSRDSYLEYSSIKIFGTNYELRL